MYRKILLVYLLCFVSAISINAQDNAIADAINQRMLNANSKNKLSEKDLKHGNSILKGWSLGFGFGLTQFGGDIRQYSHYPAYQQENSFSELGSAVSVSLQKQINLITSLSAEFIVGSFSGLRRENEYLGYNVYDPYDNYEGGGDRFVTSFKEADLILNFDMSRLSSYFFKNTINCKLSFDAKLGVGYNIFTSLRRNLKSGTYLYSFGYEDEGSNSSGFDYGNIKNETFSSPIETVYIYGLRAKYNLNKRLNLLLDYTIRNGKTDKWDASLMSTQNSSDKFSFLSLGLQYKLGNNNNDEWESPIDGLKEDVKILLVNIDGFTEDKDSDGVADLFDTSPSTPIGVPTDGSGNPLDVDMDNIPDYLDSDPFSNRGAQVDVNGVELDDDRDGVPNSIDLETATKLGSIVNPLGVNVKANNYDQIKELIYLPSIYFNSASARIVKSNNNRIATIAFMLKNNSQIKLNVIGHTDEAGSPDFNKELGLKRANSVINYLEVNYGIDVSRLRPFTEGEDIPLFKASNMNSDAERNTSKSNISEINRRVDFEIID